MSTLPSTRASTQLETRVQAMAGFTQGVAERARAVQGLGIGDVSYLGILPKYTKPQIIPASGGKGGFYLTRMADHPHHSKGAHTFPLWFQNRMDRVTDSGIHFHDIKIIDEVNEHQIALIQKGQLLKALEPTRRGEDLALVGRKVGNTVSAAAPVVGVAAIVTLGLVALPLLLIAASAAGVAANGIDPAICGTFLDEETGLESWVYLGEFYHRVPNR